MEKSEVQKNYCTPPPTPLRQLKTSREPLKRVDTFWEKVPIGNDHIMLAFFGVIFQI